MSISSAGIQLALDLKEHDGITIGCAKNEIIAYIEHKKYAKYIPETFEGYNVVTHITGKFILL